MRKKLSIVFLTIILCILTKSAVFAQTDQTNEVYRIFVTSKTDIDISGYEETGLLRAGWGCQLNVALAEMSEDFSGEITQSDRACYLRTGETMVKNVCWEALLPDGTTTQPHSINKMRDPKHYFDDDAELWEYASFRIPFEMTGVMTVRALVDGKVVACFDVTVIDTDNYGEKISGWRYSFKDRFYISEQGKLVKGWFLQDGNWYYMDQDGIMQKGWHYIPWNGEYNWYYFEDGQAASTRGRMLRGWQLVDEKWYYLKKDGAMASNEWINGYWLSADGSWRYKPKGRWRKNNNGWWFEDSAGWYPKNETVKINNLLYSFSMDGYWIP